MSRPTDWITTREAATILNVHPLTVTKLIGRGALRRRSKRPCLRRSDVEDLAHHRAQPKPPKAPPPVRHDVPPDTEHEWVRGNEAAAAILGVSPSRISQLAAQGRLPFTYSKTSRRWYRVDHLELVARARQVRFHGKQVK